jgi:autotransporter-associated beta strand protein
MKPNTTFRSWLALAGSSLLAVSSASAVNYTWGGGNLLWNNTSATGWNGGPPAAADTATINSGTVTFAANDTYGDAANTSSAAITINTGGTLASGGRFNSLWNLSLGGGTLLSNGGVNSAFPTFALAGTVTAAASVTSSISTGTGSNNIINLGNGNTSATTNTTFNVGAAGTLTVGTVLQNHWYWNGGNTMSTAGLIKTGNGQMNLNATNTYTGATAVNGGKLSIGSTGTINTTSGISIGAGEFNYNSSTALTKGVSFSSTGGTLSGSGTINPAVNVTSGNTLAIGNSVGVMNFGNNLTIGGTYLFELDNTLNTADLGDVAGTLTLGGTLDLVQLGAYTVGDKFTLFAYDGLLSGLLKDSGGVTNILDDTNFTDAGGVWTINYNDTTAGLNGGVSGSNTYVTITAIPEPEAALLGSLGLLALLRRRR